jgi:O-antigen/teichoic acid export membrane protein
MIILIIPMIVSPYLTRTLGGTSLGIYSYTYSIAYYFVVFAMLGINKHGQRIISQRRENLSGLRSTFWSLYSVHFIVSLLAVLAYCVYVVEICKSDVSIALIQTVYVASAAFDLTWLFYGLEKFKMVAVRNAVIRLMNTVCIFFFVKQPSDVGWYTMIMAISALTGHLVLIPQVMRAIPPFKFGWKDVQEHFKPLFTLFAAAVAVTLYTVFDKTLIGLMASKEAVAYYEYSNKIVNIPIAFISVISTVLYPKACRYAGEKKYREMKNNMEMSLNISSIIGFASCFGLLAIANQFAVLYYGDEFAECGRIISMMCPLILILGIGEAVRSQYIYPLKMDITMVKVTSLNVVVNLFLSALLIPSLGVSGAVIGTVAAEITGFVVEIFLVRKYISARWLIIECMPYVVAGLAMFIVMKGIGEGLENGWASLGIQVLVGAAIYCLGVTGYILLFRKEITNMCLKKVKNVLKIRGGGIAHKKFKEISLLLFGCIRLNYVWEG